jgi:branched-chain amino acid transport system ATP-binding protein
VLAMLNLEDVHAGYGHVAAVDGVSLRVDDGELVALVGANGAGKSSVLRTISGLLKPTRGSISFLGRRIDSLAPPAIVRLGISHCPEARQIWPEMSVEENLLMGAFTRRDPDGIAQSLAHMYERFPRLEERRAQYAGTLSGGEQQMLAIGRALMSKPRLVLFDEPSLGLSPLLVAELSQTIRAINEQGVTVLLVEQNVNMALSLASRAYVLLTGKVAIADSAEHLRRDPGLFKAYLGG